MSGKKRVLIVPDDRGGLAGLLCLDDYGEEYHRRNRAYGKEIVAVVPIDDELKDFGGIVEGLCMLDGAMLQGMPISGLFGLLVKIGFDAGRASAADKPPSTRRSRG
jgi:hypothetical protein